MTHRTTSLNPRPGVTLIEVLVAIFVMAIGLMALLTLFPLGALNMAQAIKDDRTANAGQNAIAVFRGVWRELCSMNATDPDPILDAAMLDPDFDPSTGNNGPMPTRANANGSSYPVYLDAIGYSAYTGNYQSWVAGNPTNGLPRRSLSLVQNAGAYQTMLTRYYFTARDDLVFAKNGQIDSTAGYVQREGRYSWAYLVRRPRAGDPRTLDVDVVVSSGRALDLIPGSLQPTGENAFGAQFYQGNTYAYIQYAPGQTQPPLRRGGWILDATMTNSANPNQGPNGYFYRIANLSDPFTAGNGNLQLDLELRTNAIADSGPNGVAVVMPDVVEVFEKGIVVP